MSQHSVLEFLDANRGTKFTLEELRHRLGLGISTLQRNIRCLKRHNLVRQDYAYTTEYPRNGKRRITRVWR